MQTTTQNAPDHADLPPAVQRYFDLMARPDKSSTLTVFAADATVLDDGRSYAGHHEILGWLSGAASEFTTTSTWLSSDRSADAATAVIRIAGDFPGSPVDLHHRFVLDSAGLIGALAITA